MPIHIPPVVRLALAGSFVGLTGLSHAADGTIRIRGAVVEPVCSVSTSAPPITRDGQQPVRQSSARAGSPLDLNLHCNAAQGIVLTVLQPATRTRAPADIGVPDVDMQSNRSGPLVASGDAMRVSLPARQTRQIRMQTPLANQAQVMGRENAGEPATSRPQDRGGVLIAIDYL